jgi:tetratricopeptide (TPR) repeat protein
MVLAERQALQALKERPQNPDALRLLARAAARQRRDAFAREVYGRVGEKRMEAEDFYLLGAGLSRDRDMNSAHALFERALRVDPHHPETLNEMAEFDAAADRLSDASARAEALAKVPGWEVRGSLLEGLLHVLESDPAGAASALGRGLRIDPALKGVAAPATIRKEYARALLQLGNATEARLTLHELLRSAPDPEASWLLSRAELQRGDLSGAAEALRSAGSYGQEHAAQAEPAQFVGSARCAECHRDLHRLAHASRHAKTFLPGDELGELRLPEREITDPADKRVKLGLQRNAEGVAFEVHSGDEVRRTLIAYALGSGAHGLTPLGRDAKGRLRELRLSYYSDIAGWDRTTGHPAQPGSLDDYLGLPQSSDAERQCLDCHTTNFRAARDRAGPAAGDRGIGCERCHGPASNHLLAIANKFPDPAIGRPRLAAPEDVVNLCGQCHKPKTRRIQPADSDSIRFQAATLVWSRCYTETNRGLSCATCHSPHHDADTAPAHYESKCLACHGPQPQPAKEPSSLPSRQTAALPPGVRRVACPVSPANNCIECHMPMPPKSSMQHTTFTDHYIRVHRTGSSAAADGG